MPRVPQPRSFKWRPADSTSEVMTRPSRKITVFLSCRTTVPFRARAYVCTLELDDKMMSDTGPLRGTLQISPARAFANEPSAKTRDRARTRTPEGLRGE